MEEKYLEKTKMLNFDAPAIRSLLREKNWQSLEDFQKIKAIYEYVQNDIKFGFNSSDNLTAEQVLVDGIGQCNTKGTLLMCLLRACGIACRLHGFDVQKDFQCGATTGLISLLAPNLIVHTWVEVYYQGVWYALEGVITDKNYLRGIQRKYHNHKGVFMKYGIATKDLQHPEIEWNANDTYIQKEAIVHDYGVFISPDEFFQEHQQRLNFIKKFLYSRIAVKIMTRNLEKIRRKYA